MGTLWETETEEEKPGMPEYQIKAHIALEDSNSHDWGVARDTEGSFVWEPGVGPITGTWTRSPVDGLIHVFLETPTTALVDAATLRFVELAEKRLAKEATVSKPTTRKKAAPKPTEEPSEQAENLAAIDRLRGLLKK